MVKIKEIIGEHDNSNYGVQRILLALLQIVVTTSYSTVYRVMKKHGLLKKQSAIQTVLHVRMPQRKRART
ncbi:IS3 family transposase [Cohnella hashimotonis]|uniref:IS3 family transposase n=1 Tax=Cohnella hashimotonis TaxID=2826895 RepID=UPI003313E3BE